MQLLQLALITQHGVINTILNTWNVSYHSVYLIYSVEDLLTNMVLNKDIHIHLCGMVILCYIDAVFIHISMILCIIHFPASTVYYTVCNT